MFNFFKKPVIEIYSPLNGTIVDLSEVPDEAFSQKMIGDGIAIDPEEGSIYTPIAGSVSIFDTKHAISIDMDGKLEMIVHFGVDTVNLKGEGFTALKSDGNYEKGEELISYDLNFIKGKVPSTLSSIIITNMDMIEKLEVVASGHVKVGDPIMKVTLK